MTHIIMVCLDILTSCVKRTSSHFVLMLHFIRQLRLSVCIVLKVVHCTSVEVVCHVLCKFLPTQNANQPEKVTCEVPLQVKCINTDFLSTSEIILVYIESLSIKIGTQMFHFQTMAKNVSTIPDIGYL